MRPGLQASRQLEVLGCCWLGVTGPNLTQEREVIQGHTFQSVLGFEV